MIKLLKGALVLTLQLILFTASVTVLLTCVRIALDLSRVLV